MEQDSLRKAAGQTSNRAWIFLAVDAARAVLNFTPFVGPRILDKGLLFHVETGACCWEIVAKADRAHSRKTQRAEFLTENLGTDGTFT